MSAPLPRHFDVAGMDWRDPRRQTWGWRELEPILRRRLTGIRAMKDHWTYDLNTHIALAEAVKDAEAALKEAANVE